MRIVIPDLLPGTNYAIQVRADDNGDASGWSARYELTTTEDTTLPEAPTNVTWVVSGDAFYGEWDSIGVNVNNDYALITRYEIELVGNGVTKVVTVPQKTGSRVGYTLTFEENRALFNGPSATVKMRVRAVDNKNLKGAYSPQETATNPPPGPVQNLEAVGLTDSVGLKWTPPSDNDVIGYNIYASTASGFSPTAQNKAGFSASTSFTHTTSNYTTWHYVVRSVDKFNSESVMARVSATPYSPFIIDVEAPHPPTLTQAVLTTNDATLRTSVKIDWTYANPPTDLSDFIIRYRPAGSTTWEYHTVATTYDDLRLTETISNLEPYVNYEFQMRARDFTANESDWTVIETAMAAVNNAPPQPAAPTATANTMQIQVVHSGNRATGAAMESDVVEYEVYASTTSGFSTFNDTTLLGKIPSGPAIVGTFDIPAVAANDSSTNQRWYVRVRAVDRQGLKSAASGQAQADVGLLATVNIGAAAITSAKIASLEANKIVAGSGIVNDITIKSTLTLGDASNDGVLKSYGYVQGDTGYRLSKSGLEINDGEIAATALKIQNGPNLMPPQYADFEWGDNYYEHPFWNANGQQGVWVQSALAAAGEVPDEAVFGRRRLGLISFGTTDKPILWLQDGKVNPPDGYNIHVEPGQKYILSMYMKNAHTTTTTWNVRLRGNDANDTIFFSEPLVLPGSGPWNRYQWVVTIPNDVTKIVVGVNNSLEGHTKNLHIDGIQFERVEAGLEEASPWKPPASTTIAGAGISTGMIRSNGVVDVNGTNQPKWSINLAGAAQFGDASVRGKLLVGPASGTDGGNSFIASGNYVENSEGWKVRDDGVAEFAKITSRAPNGTRTEIANVSNPYESGQQWNLISMWSDNAAWSPGQIWVNHLTNEDNHSSGVLQIASPKLGSRDPATIRMWSIEETNQTTIDIVANKFYASSSSYFFGNNNGRSILHMDSNLFEATANNFTFGDPNGTAVVFKIGYTAADGNQTFSFRSPGNRNIDFRFNDIASNNIYSMDENGNRKRLDIAPADLMIRTGVTSTNFWFTNANQMNNRPLLGGSSGNSGIVFAGNQEIRLTSINGGAYIDGRAARWLTSSDMRFKSSVQEAKGTMRDKLRTLKVYDYEREPHVYMSDEERREADRQGLTRRKKHRGMSAQEIQKVMPEVVVDDDEDNSGLAVDVNGLLANTIQALNELQDEVDDLKAQLASRSSK